MKILHVTIFFKPSWEAGGLARVSYELSKKLVEKGHDVTVYTTDGFKSRLDVEKNKPVNVDGIRTYYFRNLSGYLARKMVLPIPYYLPMVLRREIKNFDIIHLHEYRALLEVIVHYYAKKCGVPYVLKAGGSLPRMHRMHRIKKIFDILIGYRLLYDAEKTIARNKREAEQYKIMGVHEGKIEVIPAGIDVSKYENLPKRGEFRRKYSIRDDEKVILYLGRIHKIKGIDLLVKAFASLEKELDDVKLVIVGPDDGFMSTLKNYTRKLQLENKIVFTGPLYEINKLRAYTDTDVYVLPSRYEILGVTVFEAWACSKPVIVTDRCDIADVVKKAGIVVEFDKDQLKDALLKILEDDELRKKLGAEGKKLVKKEFNWEIIAEKIEALYKMVLIK